MLDFSKLAAISKAAGFQYYDIQNFSLVAPSQLLTKFTGTYHSYTTTATISKNRLGTALTSQILSNTEANLDNLLSAGQYYLVNGAISGTITVGSSGGFPIFYKYDFNITSTATNIVYSLTIGNPSAVNDVTPPTITITGKTYLYLAPF